MQTKEEFRKFLKTKIKKRFCIRDKVCAKMILRLICEYKKPKSYKYYKHSMLFYRQSNKRVTTVLLYSSLRFEVDMRSILQFLLKQKKFHVFVPKLEKECFNMVKYRLPLVKNKFHISEPINSKISTNIVIDIAVVPVLGVDCDLKRIGFGKGMYDRFYAKLKIKPYSVFVSRFLRISSYSLCDWYDIKANKYVSAYR